MTASDMSGAGNTPRAATASGSAYLGLLLPVALAIVWEAAVALGIVSGRLMPPPSRIGATLYDLAGTLMGAIAGYSAVVRRIIDPTLQGLRAVPSIAWVPLFILWLGIFEESKVTLIAVGVFFPVYLGVMGAFASVDRKIVEVGRMFRLKGLALVRRILLPAILPAYVIALRSGLGLGWMFVVAAEFMGASEGLGYLLVDGQQLGKPDQIIAAILTFAVLGKLTDYLLVMAFAPFLRWQDSFASSQ